MRAKDSARLSAVRLILAGIKQREVDERKELTDADVTSVIEKMIKQRRESIAQFEQASRKDLADAEKFELEVLSGYLPQADERMPKSRRPWRQPWQKQNPLVLRTWERSWRCSSRASPARPTWARFPT